MFEEIHQSYFVDNNGITPIKCVKVAKDVGRQKYILWIKNFKVNSVRDLRHSIRTIRSLIFQ